ncbi:esterase B1-like isoform X1 [Plodia interpunctella]|uniref:esterase B1-like isoform X1 n=1 Tax=Plodia interpunctella TaxID=58824 RepID=UPI002367A3EA|nr:esterase B1-like isoform X1 [Plodia interpunctella]
MLLLALSCLTSMLLSDGAVVVTTTGPVRGKLNRDHNVEYYSYEGIPYAESPTGALRFKAPVPKHAWTEVLDATKAGPVCPQPVGQYNKTQMSEDCLILNIHVPITGSGELLPVFVFVHGGAYKTLSGNTDVLYGPQLYLKRELIYLSVNYRLGALGYLSLENEDYPGNAGLKDVLLSLKWIKANIERFGGDNKKVTIGGSSSGSSICHYLMLTEKSRGLFNQALLTSGSAVSFRFIQNNPKENALALADKLGLHTEKLNHLVQRLTETDAFDIVNAQESILENERSQMRPFAPFVPTVEPDSLEAIITKYPFDIIRSGVPHKVPVLVGFNSLEGIYHWATIKKNKTLVDHLPKLYTDCIPPDVAYPKYTRHYQNLVNSISEVYFNGNDLNNFTLHNFLELLSDTQYTFNVDHWIRVYKKQNSNYDLYYYLFDFDGQLNWAKLNYNVTEVAGTAHSDDLGYQFVTERTKNLLNDIDSRTRRMVDVMITLFTNFIKHGNPTPNGYEGTKWPLYDREGKYLVLSESPSVGGRRPQARRLDFWYHVYQEFEEYINSGGQMADYN